ncbi:hypothetical protein [Paenibacillus sp. HJGM_3]|uniref:hypothetical protein n=1 Tax=Paenibacillus sp. HJGM_3 TaxID=3379816 RepID=UPI00385E0F3A
MSKKLQGNGLWESSRMMLPQHREQSLRPSNGKPSLPSELPTKRDLDMIRDYILLPVALGIVEKRRAEIERSSETLKGLYAAAAHVLAKTIREDMRKSRQQLLESEIRVYEDAKDDTELHYRYTCRSHDDELVMTKDFMRAEISARIGRYVNSLVASIQEGAKAR